MRFEEPRPDAVAQAEFLPRRSERPVHQIVTRGLGRQSVVAFNGQVNTRRALRFKLEGIVQRDGLKNRAELMVSVGTPTQDVQAQVDLGEGGKADAGHREGC